MADSIIRADVVIQNVKGLHARAAAMFVKSIEDVEANVKVSRLGQVVSGDSIMGLMMLAASKGTTIHLEAEGREASRAIEILTLLINSKFGEEA